MEKIGKIGHGRLTRSDAMDQASKPMLAAPLTNSDLEFDSHATCTSDAAGAPCLVRPGNVPPAFQGCRKFMLDKGGVKMSQTGTSVFTYDPGRVTRGWFWMGLLWSLPSMFDVHWWLQLLGLWLWAGVYACLISDTEATVGVGVQPPKGPLDTITADSYDGMKMLTNFCLGGYVSLSLSMVYYKNRACFGTIFGSSMGLAQQVAAWVRPPHGQEAQIAARSVQELLVRWINAAYRLLVLEVRGLSAEEIAQVLVAERRLLTAEEWEHIAPMPSRATHIYQWINNVLLDLSRKGYLENTRLLCTMHKEVDAMRAANVWGLPSLPLPFTLVVTVSVKLFLFFSAAKAGSDLSPFIRTDVMSMNPDAWRQVLLPYLGTAFEIMMANFYFQGMLDLHGWLYSPCGGELLGHLPADNFLDFVQKVTMDMVSQSGSQVPSKLPYTLKLP